MDQGRLFLATCRLDVVGPIARSSSQQCAVGSAGVGSIGG